MLETRWFRADGSKRRAPRCHIHEERIRRGPRTQPERDLQRLALWTWQALSESNDRRAELLDHRERELRLALDACAADHPF